MVTRNKNFVGGKLKLKVKKKKINKRATEKEVEGKKTHVEIRKGENKKDEAKAEVKTEAEKIIEGSGRIVVVKNTVQGFETKFKEEIKVGYEITINNPTSLQVEKRKVTDILSNKTLLVDQNFSTDIHTTCSFLINPVEPTSENAKNDEITEGTGTEKEKEAFLNYAKVIHPKEKADVVKIRKKVGLWSYKTVEKKVKGNLTNEQKLDERVKMGRDKFCW